jgi:hypothetical protein
MNVIRVTKLNDDGSVAFDGLLGPNEVRYLLENGLNCIMQAGAEAIEGILGDVDEDEEEEEPIFVKGNDTVQ